MFRKSAVAGLCLSFIGSVQEHCDPNSPIFDTLELTDGEAKDCDIANAVLQRMDPHTDFRTAVESTMRAPEMACDAIIRFANTLAHKLQNHPVNEATMTKLSLRRQWIDADRLTIKEFRWACHPVASITIPPEFPAPVAAAL